MTRVSPLQWHRQKESQGCYGKPLELSVVCNHYNDSDDDCYHYDYSDYEDDDDMVFEISQKCEQVV